jgi:hypothetical protein
MNKRREVVKAGWSTTGRTGLFETEFARHVGGERLIVVKVRHRTAPSHMLRRS